MGFEPTPTRVDCDMKQAPWTAPPSNIELLETEERDLVMEKQSIYQLTPSVYELSVPSEKVHSALDLGQITGTKDQRYHHRTQKPVLSYLEDGEI
ncbi:hypothetical protein RRG08_020582 [Elysia crispata]|uniref:Uncharacterized protein n=1 Tax=Elysia crispata TaxID=231223 RepID=A0AAE1DSX1_9GAST|nr:hypothetical protein RRG08_020582 [Elysia crispata]